MIMLRILLSQLIGDSGLEVQKEPAASARSPVNWASAVGVQRLVTTVTTLFNFASVAVMFKIKDGITIHLALPRRVVRQAAD